MRLSLELLDLRNHSLEHDDLEGLELLVTELVLLHQLNANSALVLRVLHSTEAGSVKLVLIDSNLHLRELSLGVE